MASITPLRAQEEFSGVPEDSSGLSTAPRSPPFAANAILGEQLYRCKLEDPKGGAAFTIAKECERLFCETLREAFLGERDSTLQDSLAVGAHHKLDSDRALLREWVEIWDYVGDARYLGFTVGANCDRALFIFFEPIVVGKELKSSLMALLELASSPYINCARLVICLNRTIPSDSLNALIRDLGWVGFELSTLSSWTRGVMETSKEWLLASMET